MLSCDLNKIFGNKYELSRNSVLGNMLFQVNKKNDTNKLIMKLVSTAELVKNNVDSVVNKIHTINNLNERTLMKYEMIEMVNNKLIRIQPEMRVSLDRIYPLKYFKESDSFVVLGDICQCLKIFDNYKTIHSDLKPSNIFLNEDGGVIVNDYLNNLLYKGREEKQGLTKDNFCFVCIDELLGKELDISSDIWNFGLVFYYIKSGKYAFVGSNTSETLLNILSTDYIPLECENNKELNSLIGKILCQEKKDRLKLNELIIEMKKFNKSEVQSDRNIIHKEFSVIGEIKIDENLKNNIDFVIDKCKKDNGNILKFWNFNMGDEGVKYLCSRLNRMNNITLIDLESNNISSIGLNIFSECLKFFPNLEGLNLCDNQIGEEKKSLLSIFQGWLGYNTNGDNLKAFSENLYNIPKLKNLGLDGCKLGDSDIKYLTSHFKDIHRLEVLSLTLNRISDDGVKYLCGNITEISKLEILWLYGNVISDKGGEILTQNLYKCKKLKELMINI